MQPSTNVTEVKSFLGHIGYYRRFIKQFAKVSYLLDRLTCKGESFKWDKEQDEAFEGLKIRLATAPILAYPNWNKEFHVHVDASNYAIGVTWHRQVATGWITRYTLPTGCYQKRSKTTVRSNEKRWEWSMLCKKFVITCSPRRSCSMLITRPYCT